MSALVPERVTRSVYSLLVGLLISVGGVLPSTTFLAYDAGVSACPYASTIECASLYAQVFNGAASLANAFVAFGVVVAVNCPFIVLKALMQACLDFRFQAIAAALAMPIFVPAILLSVYVGDLSATSLFLAMYAPHAVMAILFGGRLVHNARRLLRGEPGPWSNLHSSEEVTRSMRMADDTGQPRAIEVAVEEARAE